MLKLDVRETMQAQSYAVYMMAASCFGSSVCTTPADGEEDISALPDGRGEETAEDGGKDPFSAGQKGLAPSGPGIPFF